MGFDPADLPEHLDTLYRYALGVTRDPELAADTVQDTVVRALERGDQYRSDAPIAHWLIRIAHNLVIDRARRSNREIPVAAVEQDWRDDAYTVDAGDVRARSCVCSRDPGEKYELVFIMSLPLRCIDG